MEKIHYDGASQVLLFCKVMICLGLLFFASGLFVLATQPLECNHDVYVGKETAMPIHQKPDVTKSGMSCAGSFFGIPFGNASIETAAKKANVPESEIAYVDSEGFTILGLFSRFCTRVHARD